MRIGFFSGKYRDGGSMRTAVEPLARGLQRLGYEVYVMDLAPVQGGTTDLEGLDVYTLATRPRLLRSPRLAAGVLWEKLTDRVQAGAGRPRSSPKGLLAFHQFLGQLELAFARELQLEVLYLMHAEHIVGLCSQRLPDDLFLVVNYIGFGIDAQRGGGLDTFAYMRRLFQQPFWDMQVTASQFEYQQYRKVYQGLGLAAEKLIYLPHSYDEARFHPILGEERQALRRKYGLEGDETVLIYPVQVYRRKNVELAIDIASEINRDQAATLIVTGQVYDAAYYSQLRQRAISLGIEGKVRFLKGIPTQAMPEVYNMGDVTIFSSHQETFGHGIVESLGCGTPVVGPAYLRPCQEILEVSPGGWQATKEAGDFARQVKEALSANLDREQIAEDARKRYGSLRIAEQWVNHVFALCGQKQARQAYRENLDWRDLYEDDLYLTNNKTK